MVLKPIKIKGLSLRRKEMIMSDYARRAAELDIKNGVLDRDDYLSQHPAYIARKKELLVDIKRGIK